MNNIAATKLEPRKESTGCFGRVLAAVLFGDRPSGKHTHHAVVLLDAEPAVDDEVELGCRLYVTYDHVVAVPRCLAPRTRVVVPQPRVRQVPQGSDEESVTVTQPCGASQTCSGRGVVQSSCFVTADPNFFSLRLVWFAF